jgi:hypothetical protein
MTLTEEIAAFGGLVGLLLALATLLTANRAQAVEALAKAPDFDRSDKWREFALIVALAVVTALVFLAGLPLALRALHDLRPLAEGGPLRAVFVLAWLLVAGLVAWQVRLAVDALRLRPPP